MAAKTSNVVNLPLMTTVGTAPPIIIPLDNVERALSAINQIEVAMQLAQLTVTKALVAGNEAAALVAIKQIIEAVARLISA